MITFPVKGPRISSSELSVTPEYVYRMSNPVPAALRAVALNSPIPTASAPNDVSYEQLQPEKGLRQKPW